MSHCGYKDCPNPVRRSGDYCIRHKKVGGCAGDAAPNYNNIQQPKDDKRIVVHNCFDQQAGETKPESCLCREHNPRISEFEKIALIRSGKADALIVVRNGQPEKRRDVIVLRREYVQERMLDSQVNPEKLLSDVLKAASSISFREGIIRSPNGAAIEVERDRTDAAYWNTLLVELGLGAQAGQFLKNAAAGFGKPASLTTLENFHMAPVTHNADIDPEVDAVIAGTIHERKHEVQQSRKKVGAAGFRKGTSGGLRYNEFGKTIKAPAVWSPGSGRDSDERFGETHNTTGQMNSARDPNYAGKKPGNKLESMPLAPGENPIQPNTDLRTLPDPLDKPEMLLEEQDKRDAKIAGERLVPVYDEQAQKAKAELEELAPKQDTNGEG